MRFLKNIEIPYDQTSILNQGFEEHYQRWFEDVLRIDNNHPARVMWRWRIVEGPEEDSDHLEERAGMEQEKRTRLGSWNLDQAVQKDTSHCMSRRHEMLMMHLI